MKVDVFKSPDDALLNLATYFVSLAEQAVMRDDKFTVALSGGSSPKKLYELLASPEFNKKVDWEKVYFFFGDERNVPQDDKDSNYLMAKTALFDPLNIDDSNIFAVDTSLSPEEAAAEYTRAITLFFDDAPLQFDLILLGLGDNSHTASLFPYTTVLRDNTVAVKEVWLEDQKVFRITFTAPLINQAHHVVFLVYGEAKAIAVHHVLEDEKDTENYPAQLIAPVNGDVRWFLDEAAAANLSRSQ